MEFVPPKRVFQEPVRDARERHEEGTYSIPDFLYPGRSKNGGMVSYFQGHPFPRKGFIYAEGVMAVAKAKRVTLALFQPFTDIKKGIIGFLESYLKNYIRLIDIMFAECERVPYLHYEYYCEFSKATWDFTHIFLKSLGITHETADKTGLILATIFENDDAYKIRPQDLLSVTTKEALMKNPRKELLRLGKLLVERDPSFISGENGAGGRIEKMIKMFSYLLWLPAVKRAFRKALEEVKFEWFQYDELDYYWSLCRIDYNTHGRSFEDRKEEQIRMMIDYAQKLNPGKEVKQVEQEDGSINIIAV